MFRVGHGLVVSVVALLMFGVVMVNSAGLSVGQSAPITLSGVLFGRTTLLALLAIGFLWLGSRIPVRQLYEPRGLRSPVPWIVLGSLLLLLAVHLPGLARPVNGAYRWMHLGPLSFQPSEVAKWGLLIVLAWWGAKRASEMHRYWRGFAPPVVLLGAICLLIALEDLGTAVLIACVGLILVFAAGARLWQVATLVPGAAVVVTGLILQAPYRMNRLVAFLDPYADPQGIGYHMVQSMAAVSGGGLAGRGLGNSIQKFGYLPEDTTDFVFAIVCEELGIVGAAIIVFLYATLLLCGLSIVRQATQPFARLLALGITLTIGLQAMINIAVVTGAAPTKGIALPFLSSGGTGWVLTAFSVGLLVSMDRAAKAGERSADPDIPRTSELLAAPASA